MRSSFYGGPKGLDFDIVKIFRNKVEMLTDLNMRWQSPIGVGDMVMIAYGLPGDLSYVYEDNKQIDLDRYNKVYNSTIWLKIYLEENLKITDPLRGIETFFVSGTYGLGYRLIASMAGNTPKILVAPTDVLDADQWPNVTLDITDPDRPVFTFHLPQSLVFGETFNETIPPSEAPKVILCPPSTDPNIKNDINHPRLVFRLPRAVEFTYGNLLGQRYDKIYLLSITLLPSIKHMEKGDYYINELTGFVYLVTGKNGDILTFEYVACLQAPHPTTTTSSIDPYSANGLTKTPVEVTSSYINEKEKTGWNIHFKIPALPDFAIAKTSEFIAYNQKGSITVKPVDSKTVEFDFKIPKGPPGDALKVQDSYIFNAEDIEDDLDLIAAEIEQDRINKGLDRVPKPDELISVSYVDGDSLLAYWYFYVPGATEDDPGHWARILLTGGVGGLFKNEYTPENEISKGYTINYINSLIGGPINNNSEDLRQALSKQLIIDQFGWNEVDGGASGIVVLPVQQPVLEVYTKEEADKKIEKATTVAIPATLSVDNWVENGDMFEYNYENSKLICGRDGNVPPIVICTSNNNDYNNIEQDLTDATPSSGIVFRTLTKPTQDIGIIIIDNK